MKQSLRSLSLSPLGGLVLILSLNTSAFAQDAAAGSEPASPKPQGLDDLEDEPGEGATSDGGAAPAAEQADPEKANMDDLGAGPAPDGSTQLLLGLRYRGVGVPKFLINSFGVDGGRTLYVDGFGPEIGGYFGKKDDGFMVFFSPWLAWYGLEETPFKNKKDDDTAWEVVKSEMKVWYLTVDAAWDHKLVDRLSVNVGFGAGIGIVTGRLQRNEAYSNPGGAYGGSDGVPELDLCNAVGDPIATCPEGNYNIVDDTAADRWPVYPWLTFQTGLRYQPIDEFIGRLDIGLGSSGFWFGLGADYSIFL